MTMEKRVKLLMLSSLMLTSICYYLDLQFIIVRKIAKNIKTFCFLRMRKFGVQQVFRNEMKEIYIQGVPEKMFLS